MFRFLKTEAELDEFKTWCEESPWKKVRYWYRDKKPSKWFFPSLCESFSQISHRNWLLTPGDTNLNESAHPASNQHRGIRLSLLDAINL